MGSLRRVPVTVIRPTPFFGARPNAYETQPKSSRRERGPGNFVIPVQRTRVAVSPRNRARYLINGPASVITTVIARPVGRTSARPTKSRPIEFTRENTVDGRYRSVDDDALKRRSGRTKSAHESRQLSVRKFEKIEKSLTPTVLPNSCPLRERSLNIRGRGLKYPSIAVVRGRSAGRLCTTRHGF